MTSENQTARIEVSVARAATSDLVEAFARLIPQLGDPRLSPGAEAIEEMLRSPATTLLIARDRDDDLKIVGTLCLVIYRVPTGVNAMIEDVVVDESARGSGAGSALVIEAIRIAGDRGARKIDLTSRPEREAANRLYPKLGFVRRDTNVYRYVVDRT